MSTSEQFADILQMFVLVGLGAVAVASIAGIALLYYINKSRTHDDK